LVILSLIFAGFVFFGFIQKTNKEVTVIAQEDAFQIPEDVQKVLDKSCTGCHSGESSNSKAKLKLKFEELGTMKSYKLAGKLSDISKEIQEGKMPPSKFLEKYPDAKPTDEEKALVVNWAKETSAKLAGE
jgi:uncharacterized membrane protein